METSRPWDGTTVGDAGPYSSANWAENWNNSLARGVGFPNAGPFLGTGTPPNNGLKVQAQSPAAAAVDVLIGSALVNGRWYLNDATKALTIAANSSGNPRIDTVILRADYSLQTVVLAVLQGTPAVSPTPPTLTQTDGVLWEIPLADVAVANGFVSIANGNITPRQEWANAAPGIYLTVLNNSGGVLTTGKVVIWDTTADRAVTTTTQVNHPRVAGVIVGRISNGAYGLMLYAGIGYVEVAGAYSRGAGLQQSATAGQAQALSTLSTGQLGTLLEASTGAGELHLAVINIQQRRNAGARYSQTLAQNTAGTAYGAGDTTVTLNTEDYDTDGIGVLAANQVTLQPGRYRVEGRVTVSAGATRPARAFIYDVTAGAAAFYGTNLWITAAMVMDAVVSGYITITAPNVYELRVRTGAMAAPTAINAAGQSEIYAILEFTRIDP